MTRAAGPVQTLVGRPAFWWAAMALLFGGPLISGLRRPPPAPLPVLDAVPPTGRGRLVVFGDPACPACVAASGSSLRALGRHLRSVGQAFALEWVALGEGAGTAPAPAVPVEDEAQAAPLRSLLSRRTEAPELRRGERAVLIDPRGRVRAIPLLSGPPGQELLPAITQVVNGR